MQELHGLIELASDRLQVSRLTIQQLNHWRFFSRQDSTTCLSDPQGKDDEWRPPDLFDSRGRFVIRTPDHKLDVAESQELIFYHIPTKTTHYLTKVAGFDGTPDSIDVSDDGRLLAVARDDNSITIWDLGNLTQSDGKERARAERIAKARVLFTLRGQLIIKRRRFRLSTSTLSRH